MKILRDPLLHFCVLGLLLFVVYDQLNPGNDEAVIEVSPARIVQIKRLWQLQWQRQPTDKEIDQQIESYIREQVLSREAIAMGLDKNDLVIRRRLMQKVDFLLDDVEAVEAVDEAEVRAFYQDNLLQFRSEAMFSFHHVYINPEKHANPVAELSVLLKQFRKQPVDLNKLAEYGDNFSSGSVFSRQSRSQVNRIFGSGFAESVSELALQKWVGPITSGYGQHLLLLTDYQPPAQPHFEQVSEQVEESYRWQRRQDLKQQAYQKLRQRYRVVIDEP